MVDRKARTVKRISAAAKKDYEILKSLLNQRLETERLCKYFMQRRHGQDWRKLVNAAPVV